MPGEHIIFAKAVPAKHYMNIKFSILIFLSLFFALLGSYYVYIGICDPGGKLYVGFLHEHLNIVQWYAYFLSKSGSLLLNVFGLDSFVVYPCKIHFENSNGVTIGYSCIGAGINSLWIAFVAAHKINWKIKWKWMLGGLGVLVGMNIIRIALIAVANHDNWVDLSNMDHHTLFNVVCYGFIVGMGVVFVKRLKKNEKQSGLAI
jgi:exosortase/archaeosortase family protein